MPRLLIVDDDESVRKVMRFRLKDSYEILDTGCPEDALALALQQKPDAILLDLMMPKYSGFEICQTLCSMSFTQLIPILIVSGESASRYKDFCSNLGAKGYFQKPVDFDALENRLAALLESKRGDRRSEPRVKLRVTLKIKGTTTKGEGFDLLTSTENVSAHGFLASCSSALKTGSVVEVFVMGAGQQPVGKARIVRIEWPDTPGQRCGFQFLSEPINWVLR
ncbi:MAG: response regulator [Candidatus Acidiferrales bacterium]